MWTLRDRNFQIANLGEYQVYIWLFWGEYQVYITRGGNVILRILVVCLSRDPTNVCPWQIPPSGVENVDSCSPTYLVNDAVDINGQLVMF